MAMKLAAKRPAPADHSSLVSRYVEMEVRPLKTGARNTQMSRMWTGMLSTCSSQWIPPEVIIRPGYTVPPTILPSGYQARSSNQLRKLYQPFCTM